MLSNRDKVELKAFRLRVAKSVRQPVEVIFGLCLTMTDNMIEKCSMYPQDFQDYGHNPEFTFESWSEGVQELAEHFYGR